MQPNHMGFIQSKHYVSCIGEAREKFTDDELEEGLNILEESIECVVNTSVKLLILLKGYR
ncbi:hypothetical protein ACQKMN_04025 [Ureibacillus composti]